MSDTKADLKNKILAAISQYALENTFADIDFARSVYASINDLFDKCEENKSNFEPIPTGKYSVMASGWGPGLHAVPIGPATGVAESWQATLLTEVDNSEIKKKKSRLNPESLSGKIRNRINDITDVINENKNKKKDGSPGKIVDWNKVADVIYNKYDIRRPDGKKPTGRNVADAFNHLKLEDRANS